MVLGYFLRAEKNFPVFWEKRLSMSLRLVFVSGAQFFFEEQTSSFFLKTCEGVQSFEETRKSIQGVIGGVCSPTSPIKNCFKLSINKTSSFFDCKKFRASSHLLNSPFKDQKLTTVRFLGDGVQCLAGKTIRDYETEKPPHFLKNFFL